MTAKEKINRNIGLCFDFLRQVVDNPKILEDIPTGSELEFVEKDFPKIVRKSRKGEKKPKAFLRVRTQMELIK